MKKQISMILVLALLTVLYGGAFADTLQLPGSLTTIEAESFSNNPALDEVSVAWGTETIESRAFASSGVKKIYIPATVTAIADDAFAGTSVTICSAADAYARQYADAHGLAWEDSESHDRRTRENELATLQSLSMQGDLGRFDMLEPLDTDSFTDPDDLAVLQALNDHVADVNAAAAAYNAQCDNMAGLMEEYKSFMEDISCSEANGRVAMDIDGMCMVVDTGLALNPDVEIVDMEATDGGIFRLKTSQGAILYLTMTENTVALTRTPYSASGKAVYANNSGFDILNGCKKLYDTLSSWLNTFKNELDIAMAKADAEFVKTMEFMQGIKKLKEHFGQDLTRLNAKKRKTIKEYVDSMNKAKANKAMLAGIKKWIARISIPGNIANLLIIQKNWKDLDDIESHGHPNKQDNSSAAIKLVEQMNHDIEDLRKILLADAVSSAVGLVTDIASYITGFGAAISLAAPPLGLSLGALSVIMRAANILNSAISTYFFAFKEGNLYDTIIETHKKLHTYVYGWVTDKENKKPIENVNVTDGSNETTTDQNGYYEMYIVPNNAMSGNTVLIFTPEESFSDDKDASVSKDVALILGEGIRVDAELEGDEIPIDEEHFPDEAFRAAVSARDKDENEKLSQEERKGGSLSVTGAADLTGIEYFPELEDLRLYSGAVSRLDLHDFANLKYLDCSYGQLSYLDVSGCTSLETLNCRDNQIFYLNINGATNIVTIIFDNNAPLSGVLDLSACHRLTIYKEDYRSEYYYVYDSGSERWVRTYWAFGTNLSRVYISRQSPAYAPIYEDIAPELTQDRYWGIIRIVD